MADHETPDTLAELYALRDGETDAEARLRWHRDPAHPFALGEHSLEEVEEAVRNGWPEARPSATVREIEAPE